MVGGGEDDEAVWDPGPKRKRRSGIGRDRPVPFPLIFLLRARVPNILQLAVLRWHFHKHDFFS